MKRATTIATIVLAATGCTSLGAFAATATEPPKVAEVQAAGAATTKAQPHSHLQEKTGMAPQKKTTAPKKRENDRENIRTATDEQSSAGTPSTAPVAKTGKAKAIRLSTLNAICAALDCQPGDILTYAHDNQGDAS